MSRRFNRRGYFFIIDAFIGSTIIFLSLLIILNGGVKPTKIQYNYEMAEEYSSFIMNTKLIDLNNDYVNGLIRSNISNDTSLTVMEQVDLFYYRSDLTHARELIKNLTEPVIPEKYSFSYNIINGTTTTNIYNRTIINITDARIIIASKKITFLQIDSATMFGPAMTEIKIWI
jgi:hypothetical protein